jgi:hypothetical protein
MGSKVSGAPIKQLAAAGVFDGSVGLSAVSYDGANKVTGFTVGGVIYTVTYPAGQIVVTGNNGTVRTITLDGSGRISGMSST